MRNSLVLAALALGVIGAGGRASAWGPDGHAIIADIAESHLTPAAQRQVASLLAQSGHQHLAEIASWADEVRREYPLTGGWHFVNIPLDARAYDAARDCRAGNCVVAAIPRFAAVLADPQRPPADKLVALEWVVHFVGDIHQPLHDEDHGDKGGNEVHLTYFRKQTSLHQVWDEGILDQATGLRVGTNFKVDKAAAGRVAAELDAKVTPAERQAWAPAGLAGVVDGAAISWAVDAHDLARSAYSSLPAARREGWEMQYQAQNWPIVAGQLQRAGVRLAELLNEVLR